MKPVYKRILLKLSGEALAGDQNMGLDFDKVLEICGSIKKCVDLGAEIAIVVGGGNFWRGRSSGKMDRTRADHMGMLATVINALALADALEQLDVPVRVQTAIEMNKIAEPYIRNRAIRHLEKGRVVIFGCGTGNPFFIFKATNVDGVYDSDPKLNPDAKRFSEISQMDVLDKGLKVMDSTAASLSMDNNMPMLVFSLDEPDNIVKALCGEDIGTIVK